MPTSARTPCRAPACAALATGNGYCDAHEGLRWRESDRHRPHATARGYDNAWSKARAAFLRKHPLCQCDDCAEGRKRLRLATVVDHIVPHRGDMTLFWDSSNWQTLAKRCHDRKTGRGQ